MRSKIAIALLFLTLLSNSISAQIIQTIAGGMGDGGQATTAEIGSPSAIAIDKFGNLFIGDVANNVVRKVDPSGVISAYAGTGSSGYATTEDNHPAIYAQLCITAIACDTAGNLFIADGNHEILREVNTAGIITTIAGLGFDLADSIPATSSYFSGLSGLAVDLKGNIYVSCFNQNKVRVIKPSGLIFTVAGYGGAGYTGDGGTALMANLNSPGFLTTDRKGNLYINDRNNFRIRKVDTNGIINTFAGNGTTGYAGDGGLATAAVFNNIGGLCTDSSGNIYVADQGNNLIRRIDTSGIVTRTAGVFLTGGFGGDGGLDTAARLNAPANLVCDNTGNYFVGDNGNHRIRKVNAVHIITTYAGDGMSNSSGYRGDGGPAVSALLNDPLGFAIDTGNNIFIADHGNHVIRKITPGGIISTFAGTGLASSSGDGGPATAAGINNPYGMAIDRKGNLFITDQIYNCVRKINSAGIISKFAGTGTSGFTGDGGIATAAKLAHPSLIVLDRTGNMYIADNSNYRIRKVDTNGIITTIAGTGVSGYFGDGGAATNAQIGALTGMVVDDSGNLFLNANYRIREITTSGIINTIAGNGTSGYTGDGGPATAATLGNLNGFTTDKLRNLYFCDGIRIRKIDTAGIISTISGGRSSGDCGDGYMAIAAGIASPSVLAFDSLKNLLIAEANSNRIRIIYNTSISISCNRDTICNGTGAIFTASIYSASAITPSYQWKRNGVNVGIDSAAWVAPVVHPGDMISCTLTNGSGGPVVAVSNTLLPDVQSFSPAVSITSSPAGRICTGTHVVCTAIPVAGGSSPAYDWYKNHIAVTGTDSAYSFTPVAGDTVTCRLHSNISCRLYDTIMSLPKGFAVKDTAIPTVYISANTSASVCVGTPVIFTAFPTLGGTAPVYTWYKNGVSIPGNAVDTMAFTPVNGDAITCKLHSNAYCREFDTAISNEEIFTVLDSALPSVTVTTNPGDTVCNASTVNCIANPANGTLASIYTWYRNGSKVASGSAIIYQFTPTTGDIVYCKMSANNMCAIIDTVYSESHVFLVLPLDTPVLSLGITPGVNIRIYNDVTFTATAINAGPAPSFTWYKDAVAVGTGNTYTFSPEVGDYVYCKLTADAACASSEEVFSNQVNLNVDASIPPNADVYPNPNDGNFHLLREVDGPDGLNVYMAIYTLSGKLFYQQTLIVSGNTISADISLGRTLPEGVYMVSLEYFTGKVGLYFVIRY